METDPQGQPETDEDVAATGAEAMGGLADDDSATDARLEEDEGS